MCYKSFQSEQSVYLRTPRRRVCLTVLKRHCLSLCGFMLPVVWSRLCFLSIFFSFFTSFLSFFLILKLVLAKRAPTMAAFWRLTYTQGVRSNRWLSTDTKMEKFGGMEQANPTDRITEIGRLGPLAVPCPRKIEAVLRPAPATATFPADPHAAVRVVVTGWWIA